MHVLAALRSFMSRVATKLVLPINSANARPARERPSPELIGRITELFLGMIRKELTLSYSHTQRRKTVKRFKEEFGDQWYLKFREHVAKVVAERLGPPIGTLEEIGRLRRGR